MHAHGEDLRVESGDAQLAEAVVRDWRSAGLGDADAALCAYAEKLTLEPGAVGLADVDGLRAHGFTDEAVHDAVQVVAYFNYINRVVDGLGTDLEHDMP